MLEADHVLRHHREVHHPASRHPEVEGSAVVSNCGHGLDTELESQVEIIQPSDTAGLLDVIRVPISSLALAQGADVLREKLDSEVNKSEGESTEEETHGEKPDDCEPVHVDAGVGTQRICELKVPNLNVETSVLFNPPGLGHEHDLETEKVFDIRDMPQSSQTGVDNFGGRINKTFFNLQLAPAARRELDMSDTLNRKSGK